MKATDKCVQLLDDVMLTAGEFVYSVAMDRILTMRKQGHIDMMEYMNLVDACNHRNQSGNYLDSLIYKRAQAED
jgi:hypothetical protein